MITHITIGWPKAGARGIGKPSKGTPKFAPFRLERLEINRDWFHLYIGDRKRAGGPLAFVTKVLRKDFPL